MGRLKNEKRDLWLEDTHNVKEMIMKTRSLLHWAILRFAIFCHWQR
ncbi:hypothetical protein T03_5499, partial [Trichinella britovi]